MKIPHPENPEHTENLASISLIESQGWQGLDLSLAISLFEYGFAFREVGEELIVIHRASHGENFDRTSFSLSLDVRKEYEWVKWDGFYSTMDTTEEEFDASPLWQKLYDLMIYYGVEEIFGTTYWSGFPISEE